MSSASKANVQKFRIIRKAVAFVGKLHNKNLLEKIFRAEASMVLKESMYTAQCIAKKGRQRGGVGGLLMGRKMGNWEVRQGRGLSHPQTSWFKIRQRSTETRMSWQPVKRKRLLSIWNKRGTVLDCWICSWCLRNCWFANFAWATLSVGKLRGGEVRLCTQWSNGNISDNYLGSRSTHWTIFSRSTLGTILQFSRHL